MQMHNWFEMVSLCLSSAKQPNGRNDAVLAMACAADKAVLRF